VDYCISDGHFLFQRPIKLPANTSIDTTYTYASTARGKREPHHGVEFLNKFGTPVYAAGDGVVVFAGPDMDPIYSPWPNFYGNVIVIQHADNFFSLYAHLSKINVGTNEKVFAGVQIGEVGQSGVATGSHLHFEVRRGIVEDYFSTMNPELWLIPNRDANGPLGVLQISIVDDGHHLVRHAEFTVQYSANKPQLSDTVIYGTTYSADMLNGEENAVIGDMLPRDYRIAFKYDGQLYERWVEVKSGKLTQAIFVVQ
jgi:peptidase M23-like protein